jgi:hypothetical protein
MMGCVAGDCKRTTVGAGLRAFLSLGQQAHGVADANVSRVVDTAIDTEVVPVVTNERSQDIWIVIDPFLGDDRKAATPARFYYCQFDRTDRDPTPYPFCFRKRAVYLGNVDQNAWAKSPRVEIAGRVERLQSCQ